MGPDTGPLPPPCPPEDAPTNPNLPAPERTTSNTSEVPEDDIEFIDDDDDALLVDQPAGPTHLSEGEEAISDTFRRRKDDTTARGHESAPPALRAGFVGRSKELQQLKQLFLQMRKSGRLCFVTLAGPAGCGKERLAREFSRSVRAAIPDARVLWGAISPVAQRTYEAVAQALGERFGIGVDDTPEDCQRKISGAVEESLPAAYHQDVPALLAHLMQIPFPDNQVIEALAQVPGQLEMRSYVALRRFLERDAQQGPLLLCFDGMEQATAEAINLLHYLADGLQGSPVMILATVRPELLRHQPVWARGDFSSQTLNLGGMEPDDAEALFRELSSVANPPASLTTVVRDQLSGNPRSIFEFTRYLVESAILTRTDAGFSISAERLANTAIPGTLEDILRARLHALPKAERSLIEMCAAVGRVFWLDAVVALVRSASTVGDAPDGPTLEQIAAAGERTRLQVLAGLKTMAAAGFVIEAANSRIPGEQEFCFVYAPTWDLAYELLDESIRRDCHRLAAQWLEARPEGRDPAHQEDVGNHFAKAGDTRAAAARYRRAADAARSSYFNHQAIRLYKQSLERLGDTDLVARLHIWHDLGSVYQHRGDFDKALDAYERMVRLSWVVASRPKAAVAFNKMGRVWRQKGNLNLALEYLQRGLEMFTQARDDRGIATSLDDIGQIHWMQGRYEAALDHSARALEMRRQVGDQRSIAVSLSNIGNIEKDRGLFDEAESCYQEALRLRRAVGDVYGYVVSLNNLAALACDRGELTRAKETWEQSLEEAERIGAVPLQVILLNNLGELATRTNRPQDARARLQTALDLAMEIDEQRTYIDVLRNLAMVELLEGNTEKARRYGTECLSLARRARLPELVAKARMVLAEVSAQTLFDASAPQDAGGATGYFRQAIAIFRELGNDAELARALRRLGEYQVERAETKSALAYLSEAHRLFTRLGMPDAQTLGSVIADLEQTGPGAS